MLILTSYAPLFPLCLNARTTAGHSAAYRVELDGADPFTARFRDGELHMEAVDETADCVVAADPVAFLLVGTGRLSRWAAIALGRLRPGGARPDLAVGFPGLFVFP